MHFSLPISTLAPFLLLLFSSPSPVSAINILLSNDDGWAELNIRALYNALTTSGSGNSVVLSAPAENESGTGSSDSPPTVLKMPCEFNSCPTGSPAEGFNASNPRFNYVNSYPVTSVKYGISTLSPKFFNGPPALVVTGFNVGANTGSTTLVSGTVGAASAGSLAGIPAIAFSGTTGSQIAWTTTPVPAYVSIYAQLSAIVTQAVIASGTPYLPSKTFLNVNFPAVSSGKCNNVADYEFILTRINAVLVGNPDVVTCGNGGRLPTESSVVGTTSGCYVSISVGDASTKMDSTKANQAVVLGKLSTLLSCLP